MRKSCHPYSYPYYFWVEENGKSNICSETFEKVLADRGNHRPGRSTGFLVEVVLGRTGRIGVNIWIKLTKMENSKVGHQHTELEHTPKRNLYQ